MNFTVSLSARRALVTGASGGLGEHFARLLARCGAHVAVAARRIEECERVCAAIRAEDGRALAIGMDVADARSVNQAMGEALGALGGLDILVSNAGVTATTPLLEMDEGAWDRIVDTNLKGAFLVGQAAARAMRDDGGGTIVNVASILGLRVANQVASYAVSKAGLVHLTKSMALEWARHGIRVNALCPGYVATDLNREFFSSEAGQTLIRRIPQRRLGMSADLDGPLLLLCSEASAYMTGAVIVIDGGHLVSSL
jgi:NAD(P)-dependent dehydrogenase (short-subunit alcohol dehydrogenase family)